MNGEMQKINSISQQYNLGNIFGRDGDKCCKISDKCIVQKEEKEGSRWDGNKNVAMRWSDEGIWTG
ncbi:MAG: hypothetical protein AAFV95_23960 [Bacteroidota bacterium]